MRRGYRAPAYTLQHRLQTWGAAVFLVTIRMCAFPLLFSQQREVGEMFGAVEREKSLLQLAPLTLITINWPGRLQAEKRKLACGAYPDGQGKFNGNGGPVLGRLGE